MKRIIHLIILILGVVSLARSQTPVVSLTGQSVQTNYLRWDAFPAAAQYRIFWDTIPGIDTFDYRITGLNAATLGYFHTGLRGGATYYYRVQAIDNLGNWSLLSSTTTLTAIAPTETISGGGNGDGHSAAQNCNGKLNGTLVNPQMNNVFAYNQVLTNTVMWIQYYGAASYNVDVRTNPTGPYFRLATATTATNYVHQNLRADSVYYYSVTPNMVAGCVTVASADVSSRPAPDPSIHSGGNGNGHSMVKSCQVKLNGSNAAPSTIGLSIYPGIGENYLYWLGTSGATSYDLQFSTSLTGPYTTLLSGTTATSYIHTSLTGGQLYYYQLRANLPGGCSYNFSIPDTSRPRIVIDLTGAGWSGGNGDGHANIKGCPTRLSGVALTPNSPGMILYASQDQTMITWPQYVGATGYTLEVSTTGTAPWTTLTTTTSLFYVHSPTSGSLTAGTTYYYRYTANVSGCPLNPSDILSTAAIPQYAEQYSGGNGEGFSTVEGCPSRLSGVALTPNSPDMILYPSQDQVLITWPQYVGALSYTLESSTTGSAPWTSLTTTAALEYIHSPSTGSLVSGTTYFYRYTANVSGCPLNPSLILNTAATPQYTAQYNGGNGEGFVRGSNCQSRLNGVDAIPETPAPIVYASVDQNRIDWIGLPYTTQYSLRYTTDLSTFVSLGTITGTSYTHAVPTSGVRYYYELTALPVAGCTYNPSSLVAGTPTPSTYTVYAGGNGDGHARIQSCTFIKLDQATLRANDTLRFCVGGSVLLQASRANIYNWYRNGILIPSASRDTFRATLPGIYSVDVFNIYSCPSTSVSLTVQTDTCAPATCFTMDTMTTIITPVSCFGGNNGAINITMIGGFTPYTFTWADGASSEDRTGLVAGTYTVTVQDARGCRDTVSYIVGQPSVLALSAFDTSIRCAGFTSGIINLVVSGGTSPYTYAWNDGNTNEDRTGLAAGAYTVTVTDNRGCTATLSRTITTPSAITVSSTPTSARCFGTSSGGISITVSGGVSPYTFVWNDGSTAEDRTNLAAGVYSVTVTDANLCTAVRFDTVGSPTPLLVAVRDTDVACYGASTGSIRVTASGSTTPYLYQWNDGTIGDYRSGLGAGTYQIFVTDGNGCIDSSAVIISEPSAPLGFTALIVSSVTCTGGSTGAISLTTTGGTAPYRFSWSDGATTEDRTGLSAGSYSLTITDANGCTTSLSRTVGTLTGMSLSTSVSNVSCSGLTDGFVNLSVTGGASPFSYAWSAAGVSTEDLAGVGPGSYTVTVTDNNGCTASTSASVSSPAVLSTSAGTTSPLCYGAATASINLVVTGGTSPYNFIWNDAVSSEDRTGIRAGTYSVTVSDQNNCTTTRTIVVSQPDSISATASITHESCFGAGDGEIDLTVSGGLSPYTFNWSIGLNSEDISGLNGGTHTVTITDFNSCTKVFRFNVNNGPNRPTMDTNITHTTLALNNGRIEIDVLTGTGPFEYSIDSGSTWYAGADPYTFASLAPGRYHATVRSLVGCEASIYTVVINPSLPPAPAGDLSCFPVSLAGATNYSNWMISVQDASLNPNCDTLISQTITATSEPREPIGSCPGGVLPNKTVWYSFEAPQCAATQIRFSTNTTPTNFNTRLAVYTQPAGSSACLGTRSEVACNDDGGPGTPANASEIIMTPGSLPGQYISGARYLLQVSGYNADSGYYGLIMDVDAPDIALSTPTTSSMVVTTPNPSTLSGYGYQGVTIRWRRSSLTSGYSQATLGATATSYTITGLTPGTSYDVWVVYRCSGGQWYSRKQTMSTLAGCTLTGPFPAPRLDSVPGFCNRRMVNWTPVSGATSYRVYWRRLGTTSYSYQNVSASTLSLSITLTAGISWEVYVQALCSTPPPTQTLNSPAVVVIPCSGVMAMPRREEEDPLVDAQYGQVLFHDLTEKEILSQIPHEYADGTYKITLDKPADEPQASLNNQPQGTFELFPNPAENQVNVRYTLPELSDELFIRIFNMEGREISTFHQSHPEIMGETGLDLSRLPSGVYMVRIQAGAYHEVRKLTVNK